MDTARSTVSRKADPRIIAIAKQVSESRDRKVPAVLLQLSAILEEVPTTSEEGVRMRQELWQYNLLKVMCIILRQDYSVIAGEWGAGADLAMLISQSTCGYVSVKPEDQRHLEEDFLPKASENMLLLARHIHNVLVGMEVTKDTVSAKSVLTSNLKKVLDAIALLTTGYFYVCQNVMSSQWLLQLLVSDTQKVANLTMALMEKLVRTDTQVFNKIDEATLQSLMDELVYKLTVNTDIMIAAGACRCILRFCDHHKPLVELLCLRYNVLEQDAEDQYQGLRPLLKRWEGRGFDRDLRHLTVLLESGSALKAKAQRNHECARYIQAVWRGYCMRKKLRNADRAFSKFQKSYRLKKAESEQAKLQTKYQTELHHQMRQRRQQMVRNFNEKRLEAITILPASQIEAFLKKEKSVAALRIQTLWRGHRERSKLSERQKVAQQVHAAILIQRGVRKWFDRVAASKQEFPRHLKPQGLTEERRAQLNKKINEWREQNPIHADTLENLDDVHRRTQEMVGRHYYNTRSYRKLQYQTENLLARLDTDTELIALAPSLKDITEKDRAMYSSTSLPIATAAKQNHNLMLKRNQLPWWKTLALEEEEIDQDEKERVVAEIMLETMGV